jgi:ATP-binding cassette subfamily F protein 3
MAQRADCLFLDEPTNDLDIPSREAVEDVLASYGGALFVVSHDRYLLKRLAQRVIAIRDGRAAVVDGDYDDYERRMHEVFGPPDAPAAKRADGTVERRAAHEAKLELGRAKRAVATAEQRVADLDAERARLEARFAAPDLYDDAAAVVDLQHALERLRLESERALEAWEGAVLAYEDLAAE